MLNDIVMIYSQTISVVSRHPSCLVPSRFSCPVPWFPDRDWVWREWKGRKSLNLCIIWQKVRPNVKKLKKIWTLISIWELLLHYPSYFSLFWAVNQVLRCLESRLDPSRFFKPSLHLSRPAKNLSRHNTTDHRLIITITILCIYHWIGLFMEEKHSFSVI